jgi:hypothetical protein
MVQIPSAVLSERLQECLRGRRLKAAVFLTFRLDPGFFEQQVLPVFFDVPLSAARELRLCQLEETIRSSVDEIAVYYDPRALIAEGDTAALDIRRIPVNWPSGFFHPKNILAIVEDPNESDPLVGRSLLVVTLSANLTQAGWWENVEVGHVEEVKLGERCSFRNDLLLLIARIKRYSPAGEAHAALEKIRAFLHNVRHRHKRTRGQRLYPQLYCGKQTVSDFLLDRTGGRLAELNLEVISPYFDERGAEGPLKTILEIFNPREVRILLPRDLSGAAQCPKPVYDAIKSLPGVKWAKLPAVGSRKINNDQWRFVHAKVYRFFHPNRRFEALLVGSINLTRAAHSGSGNCETSFLVETAPRRVPDWWLVAEHKAPERFVEEDPTAETSSSVATALSVRYNWATQVADVYWGSDMLAPPLKITSGVTHIAELAALPCKSWVMLDSTAASELSKLLVSTSFIYVSVGEGEPVAILVQEEGMAHRPSILLRLSASDILRYWGLLTDEQRQAFLEQRPEVAELLHRAGIASSVRSIEATESFFDTFAGMFLAFGNLERRILDAIVRGREREAEYYLFGEKYDSLNVLFNRVIDGGGSHDLVTRYLTLLCAEQMLDVITDREPDFAERHRIEICRLRERLKAIEHLRAEFRLTGIDDPARFFDWFEKRFLRRERRDQALAREAEA